jgi:tRNA-dihydrouridine synthase A
MTKKIDRTISVAPMMDYTDHYFRYLARLVAPRILLYTEMVTAQAVYFGDRERLLFRDAMESPVVLQLGGSDSAMLAKAALLGQQYGYNEINLNVGCPSDRVQSGRFGACLMKEPKRVAECVTAMSEVVDIPVTVKTRLGVDHHDSYSFLCDFIETVAQAGCQSFTIHARKAWLSGLSPKQNRTIPPLDYARVYRAKQDYPSLEIIINGGITTSEQVVKHLDCVDGVMIGREACRNISWLHELDSIYYGSGLSTLDRRAVSLSYWDYVQSFHAQGESLARLIKPILSLFSGLPNARKTRHDLCVEARNGELGFSRIKNMLEG